MEDVTDVCPLAVTFTVFATSQRFIMFEHVEQCTFISFDNELFHSDFLSAFSNSYIAVQNIITHDILHMILLLNNRLIIASSAVAVCM